MIQTNGAVRSRHVAKFQSQVSSSSIFPKSVSYVETSSELQSLFSLARVIHDSPAPAKFFNFIKSLQLSNSVPSQRLTSARVCTTSALPWWSINPGSLEMLRSKPNKIEPTIDAAKTPLIQAFGYLPRVELRAFRDMETGDLEAIAAISFSGDPVVARKALKEFEENWWIEHISDADYLVTFMLDAESR